MNNTEPQAAATSVDQNADILVRFKWNYGRMGDVEGLFVTTRAELAANYGKRVYFGEILGKHSEVYGPFQEKDITILSEDAEFVAKFVATLGRTASGYNPLTYIRRREDEE